MSYAVVRMTPQAQKQLARIPMHISRKLMAWIEMVQETGLEIVRRIPGLHDEPLKGNRQRQRSIRLNKAYRAIYTVEEGHSMVLIEIKEVSKHGY